MGKAKSQPSPWDIPPDARIPGSTLVKASCCQCGEPIRVYPSDYVLKDDHECSQCRVEVVQGDILADGRFGVRPARVIPSERINMGRRTDRRTPRQRDKLPD